VKKPQRSDGGSPQRAATPEHHHLILDQFTRQAAAFSVSPHIKDEAALRLIVEWSGAGPGDTVLDVACGAGHVVCAFAQVVRQATGIDITPAMLQRARALHEELGLTNVAWTLGDVRPLPFADGAFTVVTARYAFHHFPDPAAVLAEMTRVCAPGGTVMVVDTQVSPDPVKAAAFNRMERLRDPSHTRALPLAEHRALLRRAGLREPRETSYWLEMDLDSLLERCFPEPGDVDAIRETLSAAMEDDRLGIPVRREGEDIHVAYPIVVLAAERPGPR
jgi:ubiquinone/menaquinone biosynthesis C-methylase UbiE